MKNNIKTIMGIILLTLMMTSCAHNTDVQQCLTGHTYGFWGGLWHGIIAPFALIGSLFNDNIAIWAPNNNGGCYAFGFLLGVGSFSIISFESSSNKS